MKMCLMVENVDCLIATPLVLVCSECLHILYGLVDVLFPPHDVYTSFSTGQICNSIPVMSQCRYAPCCLGHVRHPSVSHGLLCHNADMYHAF